MRNENFNIKIYITASHPVMYGSESCKNARVFGSICYNNFTITTINFFGLAWNFLTENLKVNLCMFLTCLTSLTPPSLTLLKYISLYF